MGIDGIGKPPGTSITETGGASGATGASGALPAEPFSVDRAASAAPSSKISASLAEAFRSPSPLPGFLIGEMTHQVRLCFFGA